MTVAERAQTPDRHTSEPKAPKDSRQQSQAQPPYDEGWNQLLAYLTATTKPREEAFRDAIEAITRVRREGLIDDDEAEALARVYVAGLISDHVDDLSTRWLRRIVRAGAQTRRGRHGPGLTFVRRLMHTYRP